MRLFYIFSPIRPKLSPPISKYLYCVFILQRFTGTICKHVKIHFKGVFKKLILCSFCIKVDALQKTIVHTTDY